MNATAAPDVTGLLARAQAFARDELRPVALQYDETEEYPLAELRRAAELGLTCYDLPAAFGGGGVESLTDRCAVIEELAFGRLADRLGDRAGRLLRRAGARARLRRAEAALAAAALRRRPAGVLRRDHRARARLRLGRDRDARPAASTAATCSTGTRSSSGTRRSPTSASSSRPSSRAPGRRASRRSSSSAATPGFVRRPAAAEDGQPLLPRRRAPLRGVLRRRTSAASAEEGEGFSGLMHVFDVARVQLAASSLGLGRAALEHAVEYAKEPRGVRAARSTSSRRSRSGSPTRS